MRIISIEWFAQAIVQWHLLQNTFPIVLCSVCFKGTVLDFNPVHFFPANCFSRSSSGLFVFIFRAKCAKRLIPANQKRGFKSTEKRSVIWLALELVYQQPFSRITDWHFNPNLSPYLCVAACCASVVTVSWVWRLTELAFSVSRLQELTVCSEDTVDVHDIELIQYINVDCAKLKRLLQGLHGSFKVSCHYFSEHKCVVAVKVLQLLK